jgi:8-oxo-dGTP pyrophosphatase MutT (NUDIX family)
VPTPDLVIHLLGDWPAGRLRATMVRSGLRLTPDLEAAITGAWEEALRQPGVHLFDGPLCRLERATADDQGLHLSLSPTSYRVFMGTNARHPGWADLHGPQVMAAAVGTSVVLCSSDGRLVFGRRSQRVALYPGCAHPFGGTMEPPPDGSPPDLLGEMRRELHEEVGITASDLADLRVIALVEDRRLRQPELVYAARTHLSSNAITARLDAEEHTACWSLPDERTAIDAVFTQRQAVTPVLAGTLLAWGWRRFGEDWLTAHLAAANAIRQPVAR